MTRIARESMFIIQAAIYRLPFQARFAIVYIDRIFIKFSLVLLLLSVLLGPFLCYCYNFSTVPRSAHDSKAAAVFK